MAAVPLWYHVLQLPGGVVTPGVFDMRPHVDRYRLPPRLDGESVLDVGASNGFFSFELERRGAARVVATELASVRDHDVPEAYARRAIVARDESLGARDDEALHRGFDVARAALDSRVERVLARVVDLPDRFGPEFDLVLLSNVLLHLRDPVLGLEACREVLRPGGRLVVVSPVDESADASYAIFRGDPRRVEWWIPSVRALKKMAEFAGFTAAHVVDRFALAPSGGEPGPMAVLHARRPLEDGAAGG